MLETMQWSFTVVMAIAAAITFRAIDRRLARLERLASHVEPDRHELARAYSDGYEQAMADARSPGALPAARIVRS